MVPIRISSAVSKTNVCSYLNNYSGTSAYLLINSLLYFQMMKLSIFLIAVTACLAIPVEQGPPVPFTPGPIAQPALHPPEHSLEQNPDLKTDSSFWWPSYSRRSYSYYRPR